MTSAVVLVADAAAFDIPSIERPNPAILSARRVGALGLWGQCPYDQAHRMNCHCIFLGDSIPPRLH